MSEALILFAHGARDPDWAAPLHRVRQLIGARDPDLRVELAFLEFMAPTLEQCAADLIAGGVCQLVVQPMFIAQGGHLKKELPEILAGLRQRFPAVDIALAPAIGEDERILLAMADAAAGRVSSKRRAAQGPGGEAGPGAGRAVQ